MDNYIDRFNSSSVALFSRTNQPANVGNRIMGNSIENQAFGGTGSAGVELSGRVEETMVEGNTIRNALQTGVILEDSLTGGGSKANTVAGNLIVGTGQSGIAVHGTKGTTVIDNRVVNPGLRPDGSYPGIHVGASLFPFADGTYEGAESTAVVENTVTCDPPPPKYNFGIFLDGTAPLPQKTTIFGNWIHPGSVGDIQLNQIAVAPKPAKESKTVPDNFLI